MKKEKETDSVKEYEFTDDELESVVGGAAVTETEAEAVTAMRQKAEKKYSEWS